MMRTLPILSVLLLAACASAGNPPAAAPTLESESTPSMPTAPIDTGLRAHAGLRLDCSQDSDCAIRDIGNCCGHYPACVHTDSEVDPATVVAECAERDLVGICGYPVIDACACVEGRCQAAPGAGTGELK